MQLFLNFLNWQNRPQNTWIISAFFFFGVGIDLFFVILCFLLHVLMAMKMFWAVPHGTVILFKALFIKYIQKSSVCVCSQLIKNKDPGASRLYPHVLMMYGNWLADTRSDSPNIIMEKYLVKVATCSLSWVVHLLQPSKQMFWFILILFHLLLYLIHVLRDAHFMKLTLIVWSYP